GTKSHASYYRLGVRRRTGKAATAPGPAPWKACRCSRRPTQIAVEPGRRIRRRDTGKTVTRSPITGTVAHSARDVRRRVGGRRPGRSAGQSHGCVDRPSRPARTHAVVVAEGAHRTRRDRRTDRDP